MYLEEIEEVHTETLQTAVYSIEEGVSGEAALVDIVLCQRKFGFIRLDGRGLAEVGVSLTQDDHLVPRDIEFVQGFTNDFLRDTVAVDVGLYRLSSGSAT